MKYIIKLHSFAVATWKEIGSISVTKFSLIVIAAITEILLINLLSPAQRGEIFYIRTLADIFSIVFLLGLGNAVVYNSRKYTKNLLLYAIYIVIILFFGMLFIILGVLSNDVRDIELFWAIILGISISVYVFTQRIFISFGNYNAHNISALLPKLILISLIVFLVLMRFNVDVYLVVGLMVLSHISVVFIFQWAGVFVKIKLYGKSIKNYYRVSLLYGLGTLIPNFASAIKNRFEVFLIQYVFGDVVLGVFAFSKSLLAPLFVVISMVSLILLKKFSSNHELRIGNHLWWIFMSCFGLVCLGLIGLQIVDWMDLLPNEYLSAKLYFLICGVGASFLAGSSLLQSYLFSKNKSGKVILSVFISTIPLILLVFYKFENVLTVLLFIQFSYLIQFAVNLHQYKRLSK